MEESLVRFRLPSWMGLLGAAVLLTAAGPSLRVWAADAPSSAPAFRAVDKSPKQGGSKLKWRPYRPKKPRAMSEVVAAQYLAPAARIPRTAIPPAEPVRQNVVSPMNDPFGDGDSSSPTVSQAAASGGLLDSVVLQEPPAELRSDELPTEPQAVPFPEASSGLTAPPIGDQPPIDISDVEAYSPPQNEAEGYGETDSYQETEDYGRFDGYGGTSGDAVSPMNRECRSPDHEDFYTPITELSTDISAKGNTFPQECTLGDDQFEPRTWTQTTFTWKASGLCHKPLYFEDVHLERYGHSWGPYLQPVMSGAHFFLTVPVLPYKMGLYPPWECMYTLGYYRPGSCAPYLLDPLPVSVRAGLLQAGAWTGAAYLMP